MRTVVFDSNLIEHEIKPHEKLCIFRQMLAQEVKDRLAAAGKLKSCICPACTSNRSSIAFEKFELTYLQCKHCNTVYVSPRPSDTTLVDFYRSSSAWKFWREEILPETRDARRNKIFYPRARWLLDVCDEYQPDAKHGVVVGYHSDLLIEELFRLEPNLFQMIVTNPIADLELAGMDLPNVSVQPCGLFEFAKFEPIDILLAFDFLDRCADIDRFFKTARQALLTGGLLIASTIITGFDVLVLWELSDNIYPPDRLNLLSTEGIATLSERFGFEILELSTPGMFDTESVRKAIESNPDMRWSRFMKYMFEYRDVNATREFQEFLQKFRLSSFARIVLRKSN